MNIAKVNYDQMIIRRVTRRIPVAASGKIFRRLALFFLLLAFSIVSFYTARLYWNCQKTVKNHLKNQVWSLPSTIYAAAPVLYEGMEMKPERLVQYLKRLNYEKTALLEVKVGQYRVSREGIVLFRHTLFPKDSVDFPLLVQFRSFRIQKLINLMTHEEIPAYELEPVAISNLFGNEWEKRTLIRYSDIPRHLVKAVLAIEDRRFFQHGGVDLKAILRAAINDVFGARQLQGGSTITQQLVKNFYLTPERSFRRKISEAMMSLVMESKQTKEQIMELYLNEIYLGQRGSIGINGVGEASRLFFKKDVQHINVLEAALLAGMIQAPNAYNPYRHPKEAKGRRDLVLKAMKEIHAINQAEYDKYVRMPVIVYPMDTRVNLAPYFGDVVKAQLLTKYDPQSIYTRNLHVFTTLDLEMQQSAEEAVAAGLAEIDRLRLKKVKKNVEGCLIAIEPQTGYVRAFVGGRSYSKSQFDRISQASRQPGSVFKPVVYAAALEQFFSSHNRVFTTATLVDDSPWILEYGKNKTWEPKNYDGQYHGIVTLRTALAQSMNVATAKLAQDVGLRPIASLAKQLGFASVKQYPSLALGAFEVSPWQVATAYTVFANGGVLTELRAVKKVVDAGGKTLERSQIEVKKILHPQTAYIITNMLGTVLNAGTGASVRQWGFTRPAAGKTGTTDEYRDAWFVGYTPNLLCVVWTGYDDNTPIKMTGAQAALPLWVRFMKKATENLPVEDFSSPQGVVVRMIDPSTGELATEDCPEAVSELFIEGSEPVITCTQHKSHWWNIFG